MRVTLNLRASTRNGLNGCAHRRCDPDGVRIVTSSAFNSVSRGQEGVEALDQIGVTSEKLRDAVDNPGSIDPVTVSRANEAAGRSPTLGF